MLYLWMNIMHRVIEMHIYFSKMSMGLYNMQVSLYDLACSRDGLFSHSSGDVFDVLL